MQGLRAGGRRELGAGDGYERRGMRWEGAWRWMSNMRDAQW